MRKKITGYRLQVTGFLLAAVIVMFVAPATASAAPTASIRAGQGDTFTATANGTNLKRIEIYRTPTGYASWTYMDTGYCSGSTCTYSISWDPSSSGTRDWYFVVNAFDSTGQCTGNPFPFGPSWSNCGSNDYTGMTPPSATNPSASCPIPGSTASVSWTGVSGASRYDVYVQDLVYGSLNWNTAQCGQNGLVVCQQVTSGTSYSFATTPGKNYQWYVFACNGWGCNAPASYSTTFTCTPAPAPPTPSVSTSPVCTPGDTSSMYTISWASSNPAITYIDISTNNFATWYNKYVGGSTSTSATSGFNGYTPSGASGPLTLQPNTTYYVRSWNGYKLSGTTTFTTPGTCTCSGLNYFNAPDNGTTYTTGSTYTVWGWGTFCSGPNGTNRNRVDPYVCDQDTWNNCKYIGPSSSTVRQDVINAGWTCGNLNSNPDGWTFNWTPDGSFAGAKTLRVASINDAATSCVVWDARNINIVAPPTCTEAHPSAATTTATSGSFRVYATGVQNATEVKFPTWSEVNGQDDIIWYPGTNAGGGTWYADIDLARHPGLGWIRVHTYLFNSAYTNRWCDTADFQRILPPPPPAPTLSTPSCPSPGTTATFNWSGNNSATSYYELFIDNKANPWGSYSTGNDSANRINSPTNSFSSPTFARATYGWWMRACNSNGVCSSESYGSQFTCTPPPAPTNPSASCPIPGSTAYLNWIGVSGATRYDVFAFDTSYGSFDWKTTPCGSATGRVVCSRVNDTFYSFPTTAGKNYQWWVFACIGEGSNCSDAASYSTTFTCIPAPISPTPTVTPNLSCTPVDTGISSNMYTISWTNNPSTPVTYVDISTDNFVTFYNKAVSGASTSASSGFALWQGVGQPNGPSLTLQPNTPYSVRTWNGYNNSGTTTFTTPSRCPPPTASITGPLAALMDQSLTYSAQIVNAGSGTIFVTRQDNNPFTLTTCPPPDDIFTDSTGRNWCIIGTFTNGNFNGSTFSAAFTPRESGIYRVIVNAYANTTAVFTADKTTECTGNPFGLNPTQQAQWSDCGPNANITTNVDRTPAPPPTTNCGGGVSPRAEGLVTTPTLQTGSKFGTSTTGRCVVNDSTIEFKPFKIPTYDDLKSIYYTQSKATKIQNPSQNLNPTTSEDGGKVFNYTAADVSVNSAAPYAGTAVIFIDGNLNINKDITTSDRTKGLVLVVENNVNIDVGVKQIDAVIMSAGKIYTAGANCPTSNVPTTNALIVNGSLISLDPGAIVFCRTLTNNSQAAERIYQQPKYLVILRDLFADTLQKWSEIP